MTRISVVGLRTVVIIVGLIMKEAEIFGRLSWGRHGGLHASLREGLQLFSVADKEPDPREAEAEAWSGAAMGEGPGMGSLMPGFISQPCPFGFSNAK